MTAIDELRQRVQDDQGGTSFVDLAHALRAEGALDEALHVCLAGLSANPSAHRGRLALARLFYDREYWNFAAREVAQLLALHPDSKPLRKLLHSLAPDTVVPEAAPTLDSKEPAASTEEEDDGVVAEAEFDLGDIDLDD